MPTDLSTPKAVASPDDTGDFRQEGAPSPKVGVEVGAITHPGKVRANNEDHFLVARLAKSMRICKTSLPQPESTRFSDEEGYILIVADGMGGAAAGEEASATAVRTVEAFVLDTLKWFLHLGGHDEIELLGELRQALEHADRNVMARARTERGLFGMGTTLTMAYSVGNDLYIVHAGDSRTYLFRDNGLVRLTHDHTLVQMLVDGGALTPEAAKTHARRNVVTNVIGGPREGVNAEIHKVRILDGDTLLICSDGLTEPVADFEIAASLALPGTTDDACEGLLKMAPRPGCAGQRHGRRRPLLRRGISRPPRPCPPLRGSSRCRHAASPSPSPSPCSSPSPRRPRRPKARRCRTCPSSRTACPMG